MRVSFSPVISATTWKNCSSPELTMRGFRSSSIWKTPAELDIRILIAIGLDAFSTKSTVTFSMDSAETACMSILPAWKGMRALPASMSSASAMPTIPASLVKILFGSSGL